MTIEEAVKRLDELKKDSEASHIEADKILMKVMRENGLKEVAVAYARARKRVIFWYS